MKTRELNYLRGPLPVLPSWELTLKSVKDMKEHILPPSFVPVFCLLFSTDFEAFGSHSPIKKQDAETGLQLNYIVGCLGTVRDGYVNPSPI